jgi:hypothetical protein
MFFCAEAACAGEGMTGAELRRHLSDRIDLTWSENPLRDALARFSDVQNVAVMLDRRVDPSRKITLSLNQATIADTLGGIGLAGDLGVTLVGPVAYFGPRDAVPKLRTLVHLRAEEARKSPAAKQFAQAKPLSWPNFSQPREILVRLGRENHLEIAGLENIPHDLWASADLPLMTLIERTSLLAFQYDLTFDIVADGKRIELVPIPAEPSITRSFPGGKKPEETARQFTEIAPKAEITVAQGKIVVKGSLDDIERIDASRQPGGKTPVANADADLENKLCTLKVEEKPVGPVLRQIASKLGLQLQMDEEAIARAGVSLERLISFEVKDATIDDLLRAVIKQTPLKIRRTGKIVIVEAMEKNEAGKK